MNDTFYNLDVPVRLALLADFHNTNPDPVLESLKTQRPDVITIAGDFVFGNRPKKGNLKIDENRNAVDLLTGCSRIAPTFVSLGNHEYTLADPDLKVICSTGITLLDNKWTQFRNVYIGGLSSAYYTAYRTFRLKKAGKELYPIPDPSIRIKNLKPDLPWLDKFEKLKGFKILLCHHPEYYPRYLVNRKIDLILSGHCHGGQWRYYSIIHKQMRGCYAPGQGLFPALTDGVHDKRLVISRGLSNTTFVPRINNPTEVVYID